MTDADRETLLTLSRLGRGAYFDNLDDHHADAIDDAIAEIDRLRAQVKRLRTQVKHLENQRERTGNERRQKVVKGDV